jgi:hypothetical protein
VLIERQREKIDELKEENDLLRNMNVELKQKLVDLRVLKERASASKEIERKNLELTEEV